jgi:hypothetical protein
MAYTLANLQTDIRNYTEVDSSVLTDSILNTIIQNAENRIYRDIDSDDSFIAEYYDSPATSSGIPKYYANWDANYWLVAPTPDQQYLITLAYNKQPISLTSTVDSTSTTGSYVSNKYQDLLLYACLVNTYAYLKGPVDMLQYYEQAYQKAIESYAVEQIGRRRRDEYNDGVIRAQLVSKSPSSYGKK